MPCTAKGMEEGVSESRNLLIFLSDGYMSSEYCNLEVRWEVLAADPFRIAQQVNCLRVSESTDVGLLPANHFLGQAFSGLRCTIPS